MQIKGLHFPTKPRYSSCHGGEPDLLKRALAPNPVDRAVPVAHGPLGREGERGPARVLVRAEGHGVLTREPGRVVRRRGDVLERAREPVARGPGREVPDRAPERVWREDQYEEHDGGDENEGGSDEDGEDGCGPKNPGHRTAQLPYIPVACLVPPVKTGRKGVPI